MVVSMESGREALGVWGDTPLTPFQKLLLLLIWVRPSSALTWKPAKPSVPAGIGMRGAMTTPSSDIRLRKAVLPSGLMLTPFTMPVAGSRCTHAHGPSACGQRLESLRSLRPAMASLAGTATSGSVPNAMQSKARCGIM